MTETGKGMHAAQMALKRRRHEVERGDWPLPDNASLHAGSPMYFRCIGCGYPIVVPEGYLTKPDCCEECEAMRKLGWLT